MKIGKAKNLVVSCACDDKTKVKIFKSLFLVVWVSMSLSTLFIFVFTYIIYFSVIDKTGNYYDYLI